MCHPGAGPRPQYPPGWWSRARRRRAWPAPAPAHGQGPKRPSGQDALRLVRSNARLGYFSANVFGWTQLAEPGLPDSAGRVLRLRRAEWASVGRCAAWARVAAHLYEGEPCTQDRTAVPGTPARLWAWWFLRC